MSYIFIKVKVTIQKKEIAVINPGMRLWHRILKFYLMPAKVTGALPFIYYQCICSAVGCEVPIIIH